MISQLKLIELNHNTKKRPLDWRNSFVPIPYYKYFEYTKRKNVAFGHVLTSKQLVVDVDKRNGGLESFEKLCSDLGLDKSVFFETVCVKTGRGGFHFWFYSDIELDIHTTLKDYPGIDFLSVGHYVVLPRSTFAKSSYAKQEQTIDRLGEYYYDESHLSPRLPYAKKAPEKLLGLLTKTKIEPKKTISFPLTVKQLQKILKAIDVVDFRDYTAWRDFCFACSDACPEGQEAFFKWSVCDKKFTDHAKVQKDIATIWGKVRSGEMITRDTLYYTYKHYDKKGFTRLTKKLHEEQAENILKASATQAFDTVFDESKQDATNSIKKSHATLLDDSDIPLQAPALSTSEQKPNIQPIYSLDFDDYWYIVDEKKFFHVPSDSLITVEAFDAKFNAYMIKFHGETRKTAATKHFFSKYSLTRFAMSRKFEPWKPFILKNVEKKALFLNTWHPPKPLTLTHGSIDRWFKHYEYMIPDKREREAFHDFVAVLCAESDVRPLFALVLYSEKEGVGKTTPLFKLLQRAVGHRYVGAIADSDLRSQWTAPIVDKLVCFGNDVFSTGKYEVQTKLKSLITDDIVARTQKYEKSNTLHKNRTALILTTNAISTLCMSKSDRRYNIINCDVVPRSQEYYHDFMEYLAKPENLEAIIRTYRDRFKSMDVAKFISRPIATDLKEKMYEESLPVNARYILQIKEERDVPHIDKFIIAGVLYNKLLELDLNQSYRKNYKFRYGLKHLGYSVTKKKRIKGRATLCRIYYQKSAVEDITQEMIEEQYKYLQSCS